MKKITELKRTEVFLVMAAVVALIAVGVVFSNKNSAKKESAKVVVYCASDGNLSATQSIQSHRSYCIKPQPTGGGYTPNIPVSYGFSIVDDQGNTLKDFQITHTKQLHLIAVSKDLSQFQHVHPDFNPTTGIFTMTGLTFPSSGPYRIFADFAAAGGQMDGGGMPLMATPFEDVNVGDVNSYAAVPLGTEEKNKTFEGYQFGLSTHRSLTTGVESMLSFNIQQQGKAVTDLESYLGALGHSVILREGTLDFIHAHPVEEVGAKQNGTVNFMVDFPEAGKYKVFTQFQRGGKVLTTNFVVAVTLGSTQGAAPMQGQVPSTSHMMH